MSFIQKLDHINMSVDNASQTIAWYQRIFGFEVVERGVQEDLPWAIIRANDALLCIYEKPRTPFEDRFTRSIHGVNHFGLRIDDRAAWEQVIEAEGVEVRYGGPVVWPRSVAWYVIDPTGYEIEVALWHNDAIAFD
jgi:catechol 2,3-dioxygenase-like lactoylglutathione lyase family enzyme